MELEERRVGMIGERTAVGPRRDDFYVRFGKRWFDVTLALAVLLITSPVLALIALAIKLDSPGPIIFQQERVGQGGRRFRMLKFRTMVDGNDPSIHQQHVAQLIAGNQAPPPGESLKLKDDPRVTRVGRLLRRTSLDELPQFWNVVRGEMSVVGPRPDVAYAVAAYPPGYHARFQAMPGITGVWQVEARNCVSYEQMVRMDIAYYYEQTFGRDVALILRTPVAMLRGRGAG